MRVSQRHEVGCFCRSCEDPAQLVGSLHAVLHRISVLRKAGVNQGKFIGNISLPVVSTGPAPARKARMVVLPFLNLNGDTGQEYFSDAITEEMITALACLSPEHMAVIARTTAMHYKGSQKDIGEIARELGVEYVVEGSVPFSTGFTRSPAKDMCRQQASPGSTSASKKQMKPSSGWTALLRHAIK